MRRFNSNVDIAFKEFKNISQCCICGHNQVTSNLHFHHINPKHKIAEIGAFINDKDYYGTIAELTKCTILCANCHASYHNASDVVQNIFKERFVKVNIDDFIEICETYSAIDKNDTSTVDVDLIKRVINLEERVKILEHLLNGKSSKTKM